MRKVELVEGIKSSAMGFGCAPILGSVDGRKAKRAIECALDYGINHFDLARSYGYGEAEKFVGKVLRSNRREVIIASKFGIKANWKARILRPVKPFIRFAIGNLKKSGPEDTSTFQQAAKSTADNFHNSVHLNGKEMRKSLEESLKALQTEYLDYFFIHEPKEHVYLIDELNATASKLKDEGKIRAWGLAFTQEQEKLHSSYLNRFDVLQFNCAFGMTKYQDVVNARAEKPNIFFSPLSAGSKELLPTDKLKRLYNDFPNSVILCSMFNENHIKSNTSAV